MTTVLESVDFAERQRELQLEIPGLDGYKADRLAVGVSGGVELGITQAEDLAFVKALKLGQEVRLLVVAIVTKKGFSLAPGKDEMTEDKTTYGVGLKVHSLEVA